MLNNKTGKYKEIKKYIFTVILLNKKLVKENRKNPINTSIIAVE